MRYLNLAPAYRPLPARGGIRTAPCSIRLSAQSSTVCRAGRGCQPRTRCAFSVVWRLRRPREGVISRQEPYDHVRHLPRGHLTALGAEAVAQGVRHLRHPQELTRGEEALPRGLRCGHRPDMDVDEVPDVHDLQADPRNAAHLPGQHPADDADGSDVARRENGSEDRARKHRGQFGGTVVLPHEVPGRSLGDGLRAAVGDQGRVVGVGPQRLVGHALRGIGRRARGVRRRRHHHTLHPGRGRGAQDPQCAAAGGGHQGARVVGGRAERGGDVEHSVDALERGVPAVVVCEVGDGEAQPACRVDDGRDRVGDGLLPVPAAHRGPYLVTAPEEFGDAPTGDVAASPGDQYQFGHDCSSTVWVGCAKMKRRPLRYDHQRTGGPSA